RRRVELGLPVRRLGGVALAGLGLVPVGIQVHEALQATSRLPICFEADRLRFEEVGFGKLEASGVVAKRDARAPEGREQQADALGLWAGERLAGRGFRGSEEFDRFGGRSSPATGSPC